MKVRARIVVAMTLAVLAGGCGSLTGPPYQPPAAQRPSQTAPQTAPPAGPAPQTQSPSPVPAPAPASPQQPSRQYQLGAAATALVAQARQQAASGEPQLAQATLERALRIEPENPLLWIMLGEAHESSGQYGLAGSMGHKALQLATGDPRAQAAAWRLIGDSLRARGRNPEANEAYARADSLAAQ